MISNANALIGAFDKRAMAVTLPGVSRTPSATLHHLFLPSPSSSILHRSLSLGNVGPLAYDKILTIITARDKATSSSSSTNSSSSSTNSSSATTTDPYALWSDPELLHLPYFVLPLPGGDDTGDDGELTLFVFQSFLDAKRQTLADSARLIHRALPDSPLASHSSPGGSTHKR